MFEYTKSDKYFAQVSGGLERHAVEELTAFGAEIVQEVPRGIKFSCTKEVLYRIIYCSRLIQRVLAPLISLDCHSEKYLYSQLYKNVDWTSLFSLDETFAIISNVSDSRIDNSLYAGQVMKDAICDQFREKYNARPDFSSRDADIVFSLHIRENFATVSMDAAGKSLHKRNYRQGTNVAPMQETLAACVVKLTEWKGDNVLMDVMCGSGTILAEALMKYCNIPAGYLRSDQGIYFLPDFDKELWLKIRAEENAKIIPLPKGLIKGSDVSAKSISYAKKTLRMLPSGENVELEVKRFQEIEVGENRTIVCNPPYGVRMGTLERTETLYNDLGDFLKKKCPKSVAYVLCGSADLVPALRLRAHWKKSLKNGDLDTKLAKIIMR
ncbi:MAG: hypothetical protein B6226_04460 [Candidatus Cloacimonetes bacterium 4572_65]|nr:MAG: hypothetical protein B6226_04460 [Candidatus Cloacimonetes bacterium 4572_65]